MFKNRFPPPVFGTVWTFFHAVAKGGGGSNGSEWKMVSYSLMYVFFLAFASLQHAWQLFHSDSSAHCMVTIIIPV